MLEQLRRRLAEILTQRTERRTELDTLLETVRSRGDDITDDEQTRFDALVGTVRGLDTEREQVEARIGEVEALEVRDQRHQAAQERHGGQPAVVTREARTYTREVAAAEGRSLVVDLYRSQYSGDFAAAERISRHRREMAGDVQTRDLTTSTFGGLIPPQYLLDLFAPIARAGRPIANAVRSAPLPATGMSLVIPRGSQGTVTAVQAAQNTAVAMQDFIEADLTVPVSTIAGQQNLSRQSIERGQGTDEIIFADLAADYAVRLSGQVLSGSGAGGQMLGLLATANVNAVTFTSAAPTVALLFPKVADAIQRINALRFMPATFIGMHPRRWGWITAAIDNQGRPLFNFTQEPTAMALSPVAVGEAAKYGQVVGMMQGLPVITDASLPVAGGVGVNEDVIVVVRGGIAGDAILWEEGDGTPKQLRFEDTIAGSLTVKLVVYGYGAFTAARYPQSVSIVSGTGLTAPTF